MRDARPITKRDNVIIAKAKQARRLRSYDIANELNIHRQTALNHLTNGTLAA